METADLITSFLNNEMSPDQERNFLLSAASSDAMRLGLKSHVMIDRILHDQTNQAQVPEDLRENIFAEARASMVSPNSAAAAEQVAAEPIARSGVRAALARPGRIAGILTLAGAALIGSFGAGYMTHTAVESAELPQIRVMTVPAVTLQEPGLSVRNNTDPVREAASVEEMPLATSPSSEGTGTLSSRGHNISGATSTRHSGSASVPVATTSDDPTTDVDAADGTRNVNGHSTSGVSVQMNVRKPNSSERTNSSESTNQQHPTGNQQQP